MLMAGFSGRDSSKVCQQSEYLHVLWPSFHEKFVWVGDKGEVIGSLVSLNWIPFCLILLEEMKYCNS